MCAAYVPLWDTPLLCGCSPHPYASPIYKLGYLLTRKTVLYLHTGSAATSQSHSQSSFGALPSVTLLLSVCLPALFVSLLLSWSGTHYRSQDGLNSLHSPDCLWNYYVTQDNLKLSILLPSPLKCWDCRQLPPHSDGSIYLGTIFSSYILILLLIFS